MQDTNAEQTPEEPSTVPQQSVDDTQKSLDAQTIVEPPETHVLSAIESGDQIEPQVSLSEPAVDQPLVRATDYVMDVPKKSYKGLIISVAVLIGVLVALGAGFSYWYFGVRTANAEYEKAEAVVDAMLTGTDGIESARKSLDSVSSDNSAPVETTSIKLTQSSSDKTTRIASIIEKVALAKDKSAEYLANKEVLSGLVVVNKDSSVDAVYEANKKIIDDYGKTADEFYRTAFVYITMMDRCFISSSIVDFSNVKTIADYDNQAKHCKDYLGQHETVPAKEYSTNVYEKVRQALLAVMVNTRTLLTAPQTSSQYKQAQSTIKALGDDIQKLDSTEADKIQPSQSPRNQLRALKTKIIERKAQFLR